MKKLVLPFLIFWINILPAQNFQNICSPGITLFRSSKNEIKAFRQDSIYSLGNNDTMYISYRTIRDDYNSYCQDTTNGSVLGRSILKKDGWFFFFNYTHDSIRLNTQAAVNDTWKFFDLPDNGYIQAQVTNILNDSILGIIDSVKVITFQAKDSHNVNMSHKLNQRSIRLSQHFGLWKILDFYRFPNDTILFILAGKSDSSAGLQDLTWEKVYNFNIGDELHFTGGEFHPINYPEFYGYYKTEIYNILGKTIFGSDSVNYMMEYCRIDTTNNPPSSSRVHDTISVTYHFDQLDANTWFRKLPEEFINQGEFTNAYNENFSYNDRQTKTYMFNAFFVSYYEPGCWQNLGQPECPVYQTVCHYSDGLGLSHYKKDCYAYWGSLTYSKWNYLVFFKKGTETWGTPVAADCYVLTGKEEKIVPPERSVEISPNPAEKDLHIKINGLDAGNEIIYVLYNNFGIKILEGTASSDNFILSRNKISSGLYILNIIDRKGNSIGRAKIIYR
jgi:hypothetical protein